MIPVAQLIKDLKHIALERKTYYCNYYPANCGEINADGSISFDCIGLVKSYINEPAIAYKTEPAGYFVIPGQVIPDTTEMGILNLCTNVNWGNFGNCVPGSYLYMNGHGGVFVGDFTDDSGVVNTIECTTGIWPFGVVTSYTDPWGNRFNHQGGSQVCTWEAWGQLTPYIDYSTPQPVPPTPPAPTADIIELALQVYRGEWGNNPEREQKLTEKYGADVYRKVQDRVNFICKFIEDEKLHAKLADEILNDKWGNNPDRENNITAKFGKDAYRGAQDIVNDVCHKKITIEEVNNAITVADEILLGKWGNNPERKEKIVEKFGEIVYTRAQGIVNKALS